MSEPATDLSKWQEADFLEIVRNIFPEAGDGDGSECSYQAYFDIHGSRFLYTAQLLDSLATELGVVRDAQPVRVLEIGTMYPYFNQISINQMLRKHGATAFHYCIEAEGGAAQRLIHAPSSSKDLTELAIHSTSLNIETTDWPFPENYFDIIVFLEVLEHLTMNPAFVYHEAKRVLKSSGLFFVTTPNILCRESLVSMVLGQSPHTFSIYQPREGQYGRHNREFTPEEVWRLGDHFGFEAVRYETRDFYGYRHDQKLLDDVCKLSEYKNRGQTIVWVGCNSQETKPGYLEDLYWEDPLA